MIRVGVALTLIGAGALLAYGLYELFRQLYTEPDVPLLLKVATPLALTGIAMVIGAIVRERLQARRSEQFEEVDY